MGVSKASDHIQSMIKMPNPSQEPPAPSKAPNEDLKDMDVLCTFKIKIESQSWDQLREAQLILGIKFLSDWLREA